MKLIKLSGRERCVLRAMDFSTGSLGEQLLEHTRLATEDLIDVLNALIEVGFVEMFPYAEQTELATLAAAHFDVNPSYALQLRAAISHSR